MPLVSLGKITVVSAGTPVQVFPTTLNCNTVFFQGISGQSGAQVYIGLKNMVKATLVNVLEIIEKTAASTPEDHWYLQSNISQAPFDLSAFYLDADTSGDGLLVSYFAA